MLGAGAWGWFREMIWGGRWEGGSGLGTYVYLWWIHVNVWQNQYSVVKQNKVKIKIKTTKKEHWSGLPFPSPIHESEKWQWSHSVVSDPQRPHGLQPTRLLHPWDFPGKSIGVGCHCLLQQSLVLPIPELCRVIQRVLVCLAVFASLNGVLESSVCYVYQWGFLYVAE